MKQLIKQLREAEKEATKGEWKDNEHGIHSESDRFFGFFNEGKTENDAAFICLMRNNLVTLLDYVDSLEQQLKTINSRIQQYGKEE